MDFFSFPSFLSTHTFPCTFIFLILLYMNFLILPSLLLTGKLHISFFLPLPPLTVVSLLSSSQFHDKVELSTQINFVLPLFLEMELYFTHHKLTTLAHLRSHSPCILSILHKGFQSDKVLSG